MFLESMFMPLPPNLIILCSDEMRGDCLAANGTNPDIKTPHLDALAARGVNFRRHFTTFPKCVPARVSLMTGRYCHTDGYRNIFQHLPANRPDLLSSLLQQGYQASVFGKNHCWEHIFEASHKPPTLLPGQKGLAIDHHSWTEQFRDLFDKHKKLSHESSPTPGGAVPMPLEDGFQYLGCHDPHWSDEAYVEQAVRFLTEVRDKERPFFLQVNIEAPHPKYAVPEPYFSMYPRDKIQAYPNALPWHAPLSLTRQREIRTGMDAPAVALREVQATYYGMISRVDDQMGRILAAIEREKLFENSIVILWSDHGDFAGQYGLVEKWDTTFADCLLHVPFVLAAPGLPAGKVVDCLSDHTDIAPTLCELLDLAPLPGMHGHSLLPTISGKPVRKAVFADGGHEEEMWARFNHQPRMNDIGKPRWDSKQETYRQAPEAMARAKMCRTEDYKLVMRQTGDHELYQIKKDPWEQYNRWGEEKFAPAVLELQQLLIDWCLRTDPDRPFQHNVGA